MAKTDKTLIQYDCSNAVYSVDGETVKDLTFLNAVSLEKNLSTKEIYGDGQLQLTLVNDKGMTGTLETTARDEDFEIDLGFAQKITNGIAEITQVDAKNISVGFETKITLGDGTTKTKKCWLFGVNVSAPSDSLQQNTEDINNNSASYGITVKGTDLMASSGSTKYVDANGNGRKVFKMSALPTDTGYATFLASVPTPKALA